MSSCVSEMDDAWRPFLVLTGAFICLGKCPEAPHIRPQYDGEKDSIVPVPGGDAIAKATNDGDDIMGPGGAFVIWKQDGKAFADEEDDSVVAGRAGLRNVYFEAVSLSWAHLRGLGCDDCVEINAVELEVRRRCLCGDMLGLSGHWPVICVFASAHRRNFPISAARAIASSSFRGLAAREIWAGRMALLLGAAFSFLATLLLSLACILQAAREQAYADC